MIDCLPRVFFRIDTEHFPTEEFQPPKDLKDVARLIQISRYLNTSLAEASPGKQIARRSRIPLNMFDRPESSEPAPEAARPSSLKTKFQKSDAQASIGACEKTPAPVTPSGLFSFAVANAAPPPSESVERFPVRAVMADKGNDAESSAALERPNRKSLTKKTAKAVSSHNAAAPRTRVGSTASARRVSLKTSFAVQQFMAKLFVWGMIDRRSSDGVDVKMQLRQPCHLSRVSVPRLNETWMRMAHDMIRELFQLAALLIAVGIHLVCHPCCYSPRRSGHYRRKSRIHQNRKSLRV